MGFGDAGSENGMKLAAAIVKDAAAQAPLVPRGDYTDSIRKAAQIGYVAFEGVHGRASAWHSRHRRGGAGCLRSDMGSPARQSDAIKLKTWAGAASPQLFSSRYVYVG
jgi:hypothetical protein